MKIKVKNKVKKLVIEHWARLKRENSDIENNLKQQLEQLANSPNFKLYSELKKKLAKLQIESFRKKLLKNKQLFRYSNNLATKEFFKQLVQPAKVRQFSRFRRISGSVDQADQADQWIRRISGSGGSVDQRDQRD